MPFPTEHAARLRQPGDFDPKSFRRKKITGGVTLILGKLKGGGGSMVAQSVRFEKGTFTPDQARKWLKDHDYSPVSFEAASTGEAVHLDEAEAALLDVPDLEEGGDMPARAKTMAEATKDGSLDDRMSAVRAAISAKYNAGPGEYCYAEVIYEDSVIVRKGGKLFRVAYSVAADGAVTLEGEPQEVKVTYQTVKEGSILGPLGDDGRALEATAVPSGKKWGVVIVQEGMSRNRNRYARKCLTEAAPLYESARIYMDHQEEPRRFGRSTRDVAGFLKDVQPVMLSTQEAEGSGRMALVGTAVIVNPTVRQMLLDAWSEGNPDLFGLSHDVKVEAVTTLGSDGKAFYDVRRIESVDSVDLVTNPAAGGRLVRLVASDTMPDTLDGDGNMLKKMIETIRQSGNTALIQKLEALGASPAEDQVLALFKEAMAAPPTPTPTPSPSPAPTPAASVKEAVVAPANPDTPKVVQVNESEWLEVRRDGVTHFLEATLSGTALPDPVKDSLRKRFTAAIGGPLMPTKAQITEAVREQVELFAGLAEKGMTLPGQVRAEVTKDRVDQIREAVAAFFDPAKPATSLRSLYIEVTGDTKITGKIVDAVRLKEALNTGSWTEIMGDSITRRMVAEYAAQPLTNWRGVIAEVVPLSDFRTQRRMRFGGYGNLPIVGQGAPYLALASPTDEEATYVPAKRGGTESVTIEMIANDDVGAVRRIPQRLARAAAQTLHEFVWDFLANNSVIYDTVALANAAHGGNLIATALTSTNLAAARLILKKQTDMSSGKRIGLAARYLILPTDLEELGFQLTQSERAIPAAAITTTPQPAARNFLATQNIKPIIVDYWTDTDNWWVTADPSQTPMMEIGFWNGREEPELFVQDTPSVGSLFTNDQITWKLRHTYGGAILDFRGFVGGIVP